MTDRDNPRIVRTAATLILAVFGPATLLSGLITLVTIPTGTPAFLVGLTLFCLTVTAAALGVYLYDDTRHRPPG